MDLFVQYEVEDSLMAWGIVNFIFLGIMLAFTVVVLITKALVRQKKVNKKFHLPETFAVGAMVLFLGYLVSMVTVSNNAFDSKVEAGVEALESAGVSDVSFDSTSRTYVGSFEGETFYGKREDFPNDQFGIVRVRNVEGDPYMQGGN